MLKEIFIIIIIIASIISLNFFLQNYLDTTSTEFITKLDDISKKLLDSGNINYEELNNSISELENKWNEIEEIWMLITIHSDLDLIDKNISKLKATLEREQVVEAYLIVKELQFLIDHVAKKEVLSLKNIF